MCYLGRFIWNCETRPVFICESVTLLTQKLHHNLANTRVTLRWRSVEVPCTTFVSGLRAEGGEHRGCRAAAESS